MGRANIRGPHSEETKEKMSIAKRGRNNPMLGKHHTKEAKEKIINFQIERAKSPKVRERMRQAAKDSWARRKRIKEKLIN